MSALFVRPPFPIFSETDGQPLESGYIWIGTVNLNPITNPIAVYWDAALTQPAAQPIRTVSGYPSNAGTPARLYVNSDYSIQVQNKNGTVVYSAPTATERYSSAVVDFLQAGSGAVVQTVQTKLRKTVDVKDFGATGDGVTDDTVAVQNAIDSLAATGGVVHFPPGEYRIARNIGVNDRWGIKITNSNLTLRGDQATLRRFNTNISTYDLAYPILFIGVPDSNVALGVYSSSFDARRVSCSARHAPRLQRPGGLLRRGVHAARRRRAGDRERGRSEGGCRDRRLRSCDGRDALDGHA